MCITGKYLDGMILVVEEEYAIQLMQTRALEFVNLGDRFEEVPCPVCGSTEYTTLATHQEFGEVGECHGCGVLYAYKRYTKDAYEILCRFYTPTHIADLEENARQGPRRIEESNYIIDMIETYVPRGKLLDVGASTCDIPVYARCRGWEVRATDLSIFMQKWANEIVYVEFTRGYIEDVELDDKELDAVVLRHVIEHLHDPRSDLSILHRALKDGGILYIETPIHAENKEEFISNHMLPYHLVNFTPDTLCKLLVESGFTIEVVERQDSEDSADAVMVIAKKGERNGDE